MVLMFGVVIVEFNIYQSWELLQIPIIFEGDLAKIAAHHVKKYDRIHVSGKLFIDSPPSNVTYPQSNVQVIFE